MARRTRSYSTQHISQQDVNAVVKVLRSDWLTQGPAVEKFEQALAQTTGCRYAVALNSGTAALHAAYFGVGLGEQDEFLAPAITFAATTNAGMFLGARPVFIDVEPDTGNIDLNLVAEAITPRTKLIVPVHYAGRPVQLAKLARIARRHKLAVVEDACHALGAEYGGRPIGRCSFSDAAVLSFHPVKHITTCEGGAVLTNRLDVYRRALQFRNHGITQDQDEFHHHSAGPWYHEMQVLGYNYRLSDVAAALGSSQLKRLARFVARRRRLAEYYRQLLAGNDYFDVTSSPRAGQHAYHLFPVLLKDRVVAKKAELMRWLKRRHIGTQVHYQPVYHHPYYQQLGYTTGACPAAEEFYQRQLSIPIHQQMTLADTKYVVRGMLAAAKNLVH